jgi:hypothetical protein
MEKVIITEFEFENDDHFGTKLSNGNIIYDIPYENIIIKKEDKIIFSFKNENTHKLYIFDDFILIISNDHLNYYTELFIYDFNGKIIFEYKTYDKIYMEFVEHNNKLYCSYWNDFHSRIVHVDEITINNGSVEINELDKSNFIITDKIKDIIIHEHNLSQCTNIYYRLYIKISENLYKSGRGEIYNIQYKRMKNIPIYIIRSYDNVIYIEDIEDKKIIDEIEHEIKYIIIKNKSVNSSIYVFKNS